MLESCSYSSSWSCTYIIIKPRSPTLVDAYTENECLCLPKDKRKNVYCSHIHNIPKLEKTQVTKTSKMRNTAFIATQWDSTQLWKGVAAATCSRCRWNSQVSAEGGQLGTTRADSSDLWEWWATDWGGGKRRLWDPFEWWWHGVPDSSISLVKLATMFSRIPS